MWISYKENVYLELKRVDKVKLNIKMWGSEWLYKNLSALVIISQPYSALLIHQKPKNIVPFYIDVELDLIYPLQLQVDNSL